MCSGQGDGEGESGEEVNMRVWYIKCDVEIGGRKGEESEMGRNRSVDCNLSKDGDRHSQCMGRAQWRMHSLIQSKQKGNTSRRVWRWGGRGGRIT